MNALADIEKNSELMGTPFVDSTTPIGHFGVFALLDRGVTAVFLIEGTPFGDSSIKGRVELAKSDSGQKDMTFIGGNLVGGEFNGYGESFESAFAKMVLDN